MPQSSRASSTNPHCDNVGTDAMTGAGALVRSKLAVMGVSISVWKTVTLTVYEPAVPFPVAVTSAKPLASVSALAAESVAPAPLAGGMKNTATWGAGLPWGSVRRTRSFWENAVLRGVDWGLPEISAMNLGSVAKFLRLIDCDVTPGFPCRFTLTV